MTQTGINRQKYADAHPEDKRPPRFHHDPRPYMEWAARADAWAAEQEQSV